MSMQREPEVGDAFGRALLEYLDGTASSTHVVERSDGVIDVMSTGTYFGDVSAWVPVEAEAVADIHGPVLDIGAGAGRHAISLQERGIEVLALDVSPGAIEVCRRRGVSQTYLGTVTDLAAASRSRFSTFIAMGNNLALLASRDYAPEFLGALKTLSMPGAVLAGTVIDPYGTIDPLHLRYHEENRRLGRFPGQIRLRHRWRNLADPWFDYLFVSPAELKSLVEPLGWEVVDFKYAGPIYLAELRSV